MSYFIEMFAVQSDPRVSHPSAQCIVQLAKGAQISDNNMVLYSPPITLQVSLSVSDSKYGPTTDVLMLPYSSVTITF